MVNSWLSANTLFHFTNSLENIENILEQEFFPNYSLEVIQTLDIEKEIAIPMVCFCDIPLLNTKPYCEIWQLCNRSNQSMGDKE